MEEDYRLVVKRVEGKLQGKRGKGCAKVGANLSRSIAQVRKDVKKICRALTLKSENKEKSLSFSFFLFILCRNQR